MLKKSKNRKYPCELCGFEVVIRSTVKFGNYSGFKVCPSCKRKHDVILVVDSKGRTKPLKSKVKTPSRHLTDYKIRKSNPKTAAKRKKKREGYSEFFTEAIELMRKKPACQNCNEPINSHYLAHHNIAHILPKQKYHSVATHPDNYLFLCAAKDNKNNCHDKFDYSITMMKEQPCFPLAVEKFKKFKGKVLEKGKMFYTFEENI